MRETRSSFLILYICQVFPVFILHALLFYCMYFQSDDTMLYAAADSTESLSSVNVLLPLALLARRACLMSTTIAAGVIPSMRLAAPCGN